MSWLLWRLLGWLSPRPRRIPRLRVVREYECEGGPADGRRLRIAHPECRIRVPVLLEHGLRAVPADDLLLAALPPALQIQPYALERLADGRIVLTPYEGR